MKQKLFVSIFSTKIDKKGIHTRHNLQFGIHGMAFLVFVQKVIHFQAAFPALCLGITILVSVY